MGAAVILTNVELCLQFLHSQDRMPSDACAWSARGVPEVDRLSCRAFVFVDEAAEDIAAVELPRCG